MITEVQIAKAATRLVGTPPASMMNIDLLARYCNEVGFPFFMGLAIMWKESKGKNIYGTDNGTAMEDFPLPVTADNYEVFRWMIDTGIKVPMPDGTIKIIKFKSNGVGPMQITWGGFHSEMTALGYRVWDPADNIRYAIKHILMPAFLRLRKDRSDKDAFREMARSYNAGATGGEAYAADAMIQAEEFVKLVNSSDTLVKW